jgi:hypothetical protein
MIIQVEGATAEDVSAARRSLEALAESWGIALAEVPVGNTAAEDRDGDRDKVDPVALATLVSTVVLGLPVAALAVFDLADRIKKRRRAKELIEQARQLADRKVTIRLVERTRSLEIRNLEPDQLLDLLASAESREG